MKELERRTPLMPEHAQELIQKVHATVFVGNSILYSKLDLKFKVLNVQSALKRDAYQMRRMRRLDAL